MLVISRSDTAVTGVLVRLCAVDVLCLKRQKRNQQKAQPSE